MSTISTSDRIFICYVSRYQNLGRNSSKWCQNGSENLEDELKIHINYLTVRNILLYTALPLSSHDLLIFQGKSRVKNTWLFSFEASRHFETTSCSNQIASIYITPHLLTQTNLLCSTILRYRIYDRCVMLALKEPRRRVSFLFILKLNYLQPFQRKLLCTNHGIERSEIRNRNPNKIYEI